MVYVVQLRDSADNFTLFMEICFIDKDEADEFAENVCQSTEARVSAVVRCVPVFDKTMGEAWLNSFLKSSEGAV